MIPRAVDLGNVLKIRVCRRQPPRRCPRVQKVCVDGARPSSRVLAQLLLIHRLFGERRHEACRQTNRQSQGLGLGTHDSTLLFSLILSLYLSISRSLCLPVNQIPPHVLSTNSRNHSYRRLVLPVSILFTCRCSSMMPGSGWSFVRRWRVSSFVV